LCPNCFPSTQALAPGYIIALVICGLFFVVAIGAMVMASRSGHLENLEETKYRMLDD
jgi:hypothetical protein